MAASVKWRSGQPVPSADAVLIEDNEADAARMMQAFKSVNPGKEIIWFRESNNALVYILSGSASYPGKKLLVLIDIMMPGFSGFDIMQIVRGSARSESVEFVVITGSDNNTDIALSYCYGAKAYISKDMTAGDCLKMI